ncbi:MAG: polyamine aminopropyltransferase [Alphaproteobacteria bacterium]|nr:polyamine aminopropyltransferase [Alphaproteobacteria bacterium]
MADRFVETLYKGYAQSFELKGKPLVDERSDFQHILIFDSVLNGRVMVLDGNVQITERDECAYSEMLTHVPMMEHGKVERVMIVGGGDGAIAEEVLKHKSVKEVELVDIDGRVIELCRQHFKSISGAAFADKRLKVHAVDAFPFLKDDRSAGRYDVIIADRPDPVGPAGVLFAEEFYRLVERALKPGGFATFQTGVPFYQPDELTDTHRLFGRLFAHHGTYLSVVPTYIGGFMALTWFGKSASLGSTSPSVIAERFAKAEVSTDYYSADVHGAAFQLPPWVRRLLD